MKKTKYKRGEKKDMLGNGFPLCYGKEHCYVCIREHRRQQEMRKKGWNVHNNIDAHGSLKE